MPALDTNVLVRYVVQDDSGQLAVAKRLIDRCVREGQSLFVPVTVTLELEWVLRASFGYAKDEVLRVLSNLSSAAELVFESERALEVALHLYRKGTADFADCLHIGLATEAGEQPLWTFDKSAAKVMGAHLIRTRWASGGRNVDGTGSGRHPACAGAPVGAVTADPAASAAGRTARAGHAGAAGGAARAHATSAGRCRARGRRRRWRRGHR